MKDLFIWVLLMISMTNCSEKRRIADGAYQAYYADTDWMIKIAGDKFIYLTSGSGEMAGPVEGTYQIIGDTLVLLTDKLSYYYYSNKFLIDGDSCLIDVERHTDFCINRYDGWGSRWRDINYPQIKTNNPHAKKTVLWMMETVLNGKEILEYFPDTTKSIVIQEYAELTKHADLNLKSHGTKVKFLTEEEIKQQGIDEYLIVDKIRLGLESGTVSFQIMPEFSSSLLEFFEKQNGQWTHMKW